MTMKSTPGAAIAARIDEANRLVASGHLDAAGDIFERVERDLAKNELRTAAAERQAPRGGDGIPEDVRAGLESGMQQQMDSFLAGGQEARR